MDSQRMFGMTTWVRRLLVANLLVFLCQKTVLVDPRFQAVFGFQPLYALERPWTFVTYMFLHANLLHLAFNLLALFMFGPPVEERMGGRPFLTYYLLCGLGGAALSLALVQVRHVDLVLGASAAVYGVMLAFAWAWPNQPIYVFPFPAPIAAKWLVTFAVAISFVLALLSMSNVLVQSARVARGADATPKRRRPSGERHAVSAALDRVLDKISARGIDSLTPAERKLLADMSRRMRDKP